MFAAALVGVGLPAATTSIDTVSPCLVSNANPTGSALATGKCAAGPSAAARAGLRHGMTIIAVDGRAVSDWQSLDTALAAAATRGAAGQVIVRTAEGATKTIPIDFQILTLDRLDASGVATGEKYKRAVMGVLMQWRREHLPVSVVPRVMWSMTTASVRSLASFPEKVWVLARTLVNGGQRDPNGPVSVVGATRIGGEIAASTADPWDKLVSLLMLVGSLNLFLFLFNLVPLMPLDGGQVAAGMWEVVRNGLRRLRGRRARGPVDTARLLPLTYGMSVLLIGVGALVIWADIVKPITLGG
jgi:membrane-associated protease RseP (regulator of RpoE activity)